MYEDVSEEEPHSHQVVLDLILAQAGKIDMLAARHGPCIKCKFALFGSEFPLRALELCKWWVRQTRKPTIITIQL